MSRKPASDLAAALDEALDLLCVPAPVRSLHHFACTGGTLIAKCLATQPNVVLLSEIDPLSPLAQPKKHVPQPFAPSDIIYAMRNGLRPSDEKTVLAVFGAAITELHRQLEAQGRYLILRDHAHSQFCTSAAHDQRPSLREMLLERLPVRSAVTVRHPIDSFMSLRRNGWVHFSPATLEEYCQRYLAFLDRHEGLPVLRYEDFVEEPDAVLERLCTALELPFRAGSAELIGAVSLSGDSGRSGTTIAPRPRGAIPEDLLREAGASAGFEALCDRLGYDSI